MTKQGAVEGIWARKFPTWELVSLTIITVDADL